MNTTLPIQVPFPHTRRLQDVLEYLLSSPENARMVQEVSGKGRILLRFATDGAKMAKKLNSVRYQIIDASTSPSRVANTDFDYI